MPDFALLAVPSNEILPDSILESTFGQSLFDADKNWLRDRTMIVQLCDSCGSVPAAYSGECWSHPGTVMAPEVCCSTCSDCQELIADDFKDDYEYDGPGDYEMYGPDWESLIP